MNIPERRFKERTLTEGRIDFFRDKNILDNPHHRGTVKHEWWLAGWASGATFLKLLVREAA